MSLHSLAAHRVARDVSRRAKPAAKTEATTSVPATPESPQGAAASEDGVGSQHLDVDNALSALVEYLPAETIALYLAAIAALEEIQSFVPSIRAGTIYLVFATLTPVLYALIYAGKRNAAGEKRWPGLREWPWWPTFAATAAFMAWAITVPGGHSLTEKPEGRAVAGLLAIVVSTLLGVAGRFFAPAKRT